MVGSASKQYPRTRSMRVTLLLILSTTKEEKMQFRRTLVSFIGLTVMLLSGGTVVKTWTRHTEVADSFCNREIRQL